MKKMLHNNVFILSLILVGIVLAIATPILLHVSSERAERKTMEEALLKQRNSCIKKPVSQPAQPDTKPLTEEQSKIMKELIEKFGGTYAGDGTSKTLDRGSINWCED